MVQHQVKRIMKLQISAQITVKTMAKLGQLEFFAMEINKDVIRYEYITPNMEGEPKQHIDKLHYSEAKETRPKPKNRRH